MNPVMVMNEIGLVLAGAAHRLVSLSWQSSLFIVAVALVTLAWRRGPACFKYGLWCLVLVKLLLPVSFSLPSGAVNVIPDLPLYAGPASSPAILIEVADPRFEWPLMSWLGLAWAAGVIVMLFLLFARYRTIRMWLLRSSSPASPELIALAADLSVRMGLRRSVPVWTTHAITGPLVIGPLNPMIFIPEDLFGGLEHDERAMLLAHELAHIKRRDTFVAAVEMIALAIHWFNPLAWMMMAAVRTQRELACDDRVVALFNDRAEEYGSGLLKIARFQQGLKGSAFGMAALGEGGSTIGVRVRNILSRRRPIAFLSIPAIVALALVACVMLPNHARKQKAEAESKPAGHELIVANFSLRPVDVEKADEKFVQDFANRVVEAIKTFLYSEKGIAAAKEEKRELWFDPATLQLTIVDTRDNIDQVRKYLASLPELKQKSMVVFNLLPSQTAQVRALLDSGVMQQNVWGQATPPSTDFKIELNESGNKLTVVGTPKHTQAAADFIKSIPPSPGPDLDTRIYKIKPEDGPRIHELIKTLTQAESEPPFAAERKVFTQGEDLIIRDTPENLGKIETMLLDKKIIKKLEADQLQIRNFSLVPRRAEEIQSKYIKDFTGRVVEAIKTFLYSREGAEKAAAEGRRLWFDDSTLQLTIVDTPSNLKQVREYLASLPELNPDKIDLPTSPALLPGLNINTMAFDSMDQNDRRLLLEGNVKIQTPGFTYAADSIEYSYPDKTLTLRGNATVTDLKRNSNRLRSVYKSNVIKITPGDSKTPLRIRAEDGYLREIQEGADSEASKTEDPVEKDYQAAVALQKAGDLDAAEKAFGKIIEEDKQTPRAWVCLERIAEIKRAQGDLSDSLKKYKTILDIYPEYPDIQRVREAIKQIEAGEKEPSPKSISIDQVMMKMDKQEKKPNGDIEGSGHVYIELPKYRVSGDKMYYEAATKRLIVSRNVTMRHRERGEVIETTGYEFSIDLSDLKSGLMKVFPGTLIRQVNDSTSNTIERTGN